MAFEETSNPKTGYPLEVIRDQGYGRVWSRLARDEQDAHRTLEAWKIEGLRPEAVAAGLKNGGDFRIQPNRFGRIHSSAHSTQSPA